MAKLTRLQTHLAPFRKLVEIAELSRAVRRMKGTWRDLRRAVKLLPAITTTDVQEQEPRVAILPIGSYEQHGAYLPLITDTAIACIIAREIAAAYPVLQLPPVTIACSHEHGTWAGTVSISARTLHAMVTDIATSLEASGIRKLVLVNAHGGNYVLSNIVQEANLTEPRMTLFPQGREWNRCRDRARPSV